MTALTYRVDRTFAALAAAHFGVVSRPHLVAAGVSNDAIDRRLDAGVWVPVAPAIFRHRSNEPDWRGLAMAALIEGHQEAVLAGVTALALHGLPEAMKLGHPPTLLVPHDRTHESAIAIVRQVNGFPEQEIAVLSSPADPLPPGSTVLRATNPARSCIDAAVWTPPSRWSDAERLLDAAHRSRLVSYPEMWASLEQAVVLRRRGLRPVRALLEGRLGRPDEQTASELERLARRRFVRWGVDAAVEYEVPHPAFPGLDRRADALCRSTRVVFEFDSRAHHLREREFDEDRRRDAATVEAGWSPYRLTWADFTSSAGITRGRVRRACGLDGGLRRIS